MLFGEPIIIKIQVDLLVYQIFHVISTLYIISTLHVISTPPHHIIFSISSYHFFVLYTYQLFNVPYISVLSTPPHIVYILAPPLFDILAIPHIKCVSSLLYISYFIDFSMYQHPQSSIYQRFRTYQRLRIIYQYSRSSIYQRHTSTLLYINYFAHKVRISSFVYQLLY